MNGSLFRKFLAIGVFAWCAAAAWGQEDRRDRRDPALVLNTGGRTGYCDALLFTPDGKTLLAAGDDHVVSMLEVTNEALVTKSLRTLRWPSWREQRGAIYAMHDSPNDNARRVAIGGMGLKSSMVAVLERSSGHLVHSTLLLSRGEDVLGVTAVRFSPDGSRLAVGAGDGSIWLWTPGQPPLLLGKQAPRSGSPVNWVRLLRFDRNGDLLSMAETGKLVRWPLSRPEPEVILSLEFDDTARVRAADWSANGAWLAVAGNFPQILLRSLDGKKRDIKLPERQFARSVAFSPDGKKLAVGIGAMVPNTNYAIEADESVAVFDVSAETPKEELRLKRFGRAEALAWNGGNRLAVAGGDNHEISFWDLARPDRAISDFRGVGSGIWGIALSTNDRYLAFKEQRNPVAVDPNERGLGDWKIFDLDKRKLTSTPPADFKLVQPLRTAGNWRVEPDKDRPYVLYAVDPNLNKHELPWDRDRNGMPRCYTFLPHKAGQPVRLVVGHYWGASIFALDNSGVRRTQLLTGHQGEVMSVAASANGSFLVTAGNDQTISAWSLNPWPSGSPLGLRLKNDGLVVDSVDVGSPAWEMGLVPGDDIAMVVLDRVPKYRVPGAFTLTQGDTRIEDTAPPTGTVAAARATLQNPVPGKELFLAVKRAGRSEMLAIKSTVQTRPLWRFFPTRDGEWVLWMWQGSYYDTSSAGDYFVGWEVNDAAKDPSLQQEPRFYRAEKLRRWFHRDDVIQELIESRDVAAALRQAQGKNPVPLNFVGLEPPAVSMQLSAKVATEPVTVLLSAAPRGQNPDHIPQRAELWINDFRFKLWELKGSKFSETVTIPQAQLRSGENKLIFQVFNRLGGRDEVIGSITNPNAPPQPKLLGLAVGIDDYRASSEKSPDGTRNLLTNLQSAVNDARRQKEQWSAQAGKLYVTADVDLKPNNEAQPKEILKALDGLRKKAGPDDVILLTFSGHGDFLKAPKGKGSEDSLFVFCGPEYNRANYAEKGIDSKTLYEALVSIPGHKILIIDACHSGEAVFSPVRALTPAGLGPTILAACDRSELSYEHKNIGNGVFTCALLEAMDKAPADALGTLSVQALFEYARARVPEILMDLGHSKDAQHPQCFSPLTQQFPVMKR
jgi:WD40 repeat protein